MHAVGMQQLFLALSEAIRSRLMLCLLQVVYVGDGNNITHSWIRLAARLNLDLVCACPEGFEPDMATVDLANSSGAGKVSISHDVMEVGP